MTVVCLTETEGLHPIMKKEKKLASYVFFPKSTLKGCPHTVLQLWL